MEAGWYYLSLLDSVIIRKPAATTITAPTRIVVLADSR